MPMSPEWFPAFQEPKEFIMAVIPCQALVPIYAFWWHPSFTQNTWTNATCCKQFLVGSPRANELKGRSMDST